MEESSLSDTAVREIASTYTASHFQVRGSEDLGSSNKGTCPGHPYADVVFSFAFHQVLRSLAQDLDSDDLRPSVPTATFVDGEIHQGEDTKLPIPAFFDDFVLVVTAPTPQEVIQKCARILQNNKNGKAFATKGIEDNENRGNTEALLQFNGTGAVKVKEDLSTGSQQIHVDHPLFGELDIGITQQYKHLGSINAGPHKYDQDVEARTAQARATIQSSRRFVLRRKAFPGSKD